MPKGGIRTWVIGALMLACGLPLITVYIFTVVVTRAEMRDASGDMLDKLTAQVAAQVSVIIDRTEHDLIAVAKSASTAEAGDEKLNRVLEKIRSLNQMIVSIELLDENGFLHASSHETTGRMQDLTPWFEAASAGQWSVSRAKRTSADGELYVSVYAPVRNPESRAKVVKISVTLGPIRDVIDQTEVMLGGNVYLLDADGFVLEQRGVRRSIERAPERVLAAIGGEADAEFTNAVVPVPGLEETPVDGWTVVWSERTSELTSAGQRIEQMVLGAAGIGALIALGLGIYFTRIIGGPLIRLSEVSLSAAAGELEGRVPMNGPREVQELGWAFNRMLAEVKRSKDALEGQVEERTRSLERSRAEERKLANQLSASFEAAAEGVLVISEEGSILKANGRMIEFFGVEFDGSEGVDTKGVIERVTACFKSRDEFERFWNDPAVEGLEEWETVCCGIERTLRVSASAVRDVDGREFARLWMFHDVTEQRQLQRGLQQAQKMEAVGQLAGGIAHDFNNLLTGIDGNLALIEMDGASHLSGDGREAMGMARQSCHRAAGLVRGLLGYSRQSCLERGRFSPNQVVQDTVKLLRVTVDPSIRFVTHLDPSAGDVHIDVAQIQQIVINLSLNARDAMPEGGNVTLRTRAEIVDACKGMGDGVLRTEGSFVVLDVEDEGDGVSDAIRGRIFEPFFTTKETGKGTGLGLAMSQGIAQQHGGWIECSVSAGGGAKFSVYLPELMPSETREEEGALVADGTTEESGSLRVLVADDEFVVRVVAEGMLRKLGHEVTGVANGREAVEACRQNEGDAFDLVVLDMTMPEMSGGTALGILKEEMPDLPVVICSGFSLDFASFEDEGKAKPDLILQKPYSPDQLAQAVRQASRPASAPATVAG